MAGLITRASIEEVRERARLEEIVGEYVTLKTAGVGALKGLCPFHDEKTPSFNVRPHVGRWHCFGCGEGGDAIAFLEKIEHISFVEAVELLAHKTGVQLQYEKSSGGKSAPTEVKRARLIEAHRIAEEFYIKKLGEAEGEAARKLLYDRGFDDAAIAHFRVGYAPRAWDSLLQELRRRGFTEKEISATGLTSQGARGVYDRFRGRVMWPIHSIVGDPIGFGARKLGDEEGPKYLNTPETILYKKSQVLYGLDLAKKEIAAQRKIVVVEGYTDVMAAHLAGVRTAVATCGTAFGHEHAKIVRRIIGDYAGQGSGMVLHDGAGFGGEIIFTFDGDEAGQKAALRAFREDQTFGAQTFVAVSPEGMDPCDLRLAYGDAAVAELVAKRKPLFSFVIQSMLAKLPLHTAEGRAAGLHQSAPVVAAIKDRVLRGEYTRILSGWLGMDIDTVAQAVADALRMQKNQIPEIAAPGEENAPRSAPVLEERAQISDPVARVERAALEVIVQLPWLAYEANAQDLPSESFTVPIHRAIFDTILAAGGVAAHRQYFQNLQDKGMENKEAEERANKWYVEQISEAATDMTRQALRELAVSPLPEDTQADMWPYVRGVMMGLIKHGYTRQIAELRGQMQRTESDSPERAALYQRLIELESNRRAFDETDT